MLLSIRIFVALALVSLGACRMPVAIDGQGMVFGERSGELYSDGYVFDITEDFQEVLWPIPAPGHSFSGWTRICNKTYGPCELTIPRELWEQDAEVPLGSRFAPNYQGPLRLVDYDLFWSESTRTLIIPMDSLVLEGLSENAVPRLFMAPADMGEVVTARQEDGDYLFTLPSDRYDAVDYWLFVSATDSQGVIATVSFDFGLADQVQAANLRPHSRVSPWAEVLATCVSANNPFDVCTLEELPFLGSITDEPSIPDIMQRTVVSHAWMGMRFAQVLQQMPREMLKLFRGVTAVVISADVRPAFYITSSGAIYLDAQDLWLTPAERATIDWEADYRSGFGSALNVISAEFYIQGNQPAWYYSYEYEEWETRRLDEIVWPMANLLAHELAHANDAMPPALLPMLSPQETPLDATFRVSRQTPSNLLAAIYPLRSELLLELGEVLFLGRPASSLMLSLTPQDVGLAFEADDASALYSYSTQFEDTAMLVEEVLTRYYFGLDRIVSFLDVPASLDPDCEEFTLRWGVRNRVASPSVRARAELILGDILGEDDISRYLNSVPATRDLRRGIGLCESLEQLPGLPWSLPGKFIAPLDLARHRAVQVKTHRQMHERTQRGRVRDPR